jgi:hypothetical protein
MTSLLDNLKCLPVWQQTRYIVTYDYIWFNKYMV